MAHRHAALVPWRSASTYCPPAVQARPTLTRTIGVPQFKAVNQDTLLLDATCCCGVPSFAKGPQVTFERDYPNGFPNQVDPPPYFDAISSARCRGAERTRDSQPHDSPRALASFG